MAGIQVENIVVLGVDGNKYGTLAQKISEFFKAHPDYKYIGLSVIEQSQVQGNTIAFIVYEVS